MRKRIIAGNWKMNMTLLQAEALAGALLAGYTHNSAREAVVCPPAVVLAALRSRLAGSGIQLGAQNMHEAESGAYTGEVSAAMLVGTGCTHVILGHSERRALFGETDAIINKKIKAALLARLVPIFCVGEVLAERKAGRAEEVTAGQVRAGLQGIGTSDILACVIAYEPVWAIGTGETATPAQADDMHAAIRRVLNQIYGEVVADSVSILYGGSVNDKNIDELIARPNIDGALVGGASLKAESFLRIINYR
ncbi:MAG: triose-phosphate isomerase [Spirochaetota bacterium]|nr:triose-phosphate isomerase [Spirochaetota bacterium]